MIHHHCDSKSHVNYALDAYSVFSMPNAGDQINSYSISQTGDSNLYYETGCCDHIKYNIIPQALAIATIL